jgi:hypothetical protein
MKKNEVKNQSNCCRSVDGHSGSNINIEKTGNSQLLTLKKRLYLEAMMYIALHVTVTNAVSAQLLGRY